MCAVTSPDLESDQSLPTSEEIITPWSSRRPGVDWLGIASLAIAFRAGGLLEVISYMAYPAIQIGLS